MSSNPIYDQPLAFLATSFQEHGHWWRSSSPASFILFAPYFLRCRGNSGYWQMLRCWATVCMSYVMPTGYRCDSGLCGFVNGTRTLFIFHNIQSKARQLCRDQDLHQPLYTFDGSGHSITDD
jgi:hypothetical protein